MSRNWRGCAPCHEHGDQGPSGAEQRAATRRFCEDLFDGAAIGRPVTVSASPRESYGAGESLALDLIEQGGARVRPRDGTRRGRQPRRDVCGR